MEQAFQNLKQELSRAATLNRPDYSLPFCLDVSDKTNTAADILQQKQQGDQHVLLFASLLLEAI